MYSLLDSTWESSCTIQGNLYFDTVVGVLWGAFSSLFAFSRRSSCKTCCSYKSQRCVSPTIDYEKRKTSSKFHAFLNKSLVKSWSWTPWTGDRTRCDSINCIFFSKRDLSLTLDACNSRLHKILGQAESVNFLRWIIHYSFAQLSVKFNGMYFVFICIK